MKVTITLPDSQLAEIRKLVDAHESTSVSGFVRQAVQKVATQRCRVSRGG
ncbi:MAG: ribbon-helix-helix protein, CopG family [Acidobacteria bacterium]|nr:ribbon-helix-helix protein, CopG family [Acidobacteriota bacterium]